MANTQPHTLPAAAGTRVPAFEFPKRKRWADLLLTELVDDIAFVLSPTYKIMYCGPAITELLGWKDVGLSDMEFIDLVSRMTSYCSQIVGKLTFRPYSRRSRPVSHRIRASTSEPG